MHIQKNETKKKSYRHRCWLKSKLIVGKYLYFSFVFVWFSLWMVWRCAKYFLHSKYWEFLHLNNFAITKIFPSTITKHKHSYWQWNFPMTVGLFVGWSVSLSVYFLRGGRKVLCSYRSSCISIYSTVSRCGASLGPTLPLCLYVPTHLSDMSLSPSQMQHENPYLRHVLVCSVQAMNENRR